MIRATGCGPYVPGYVGGTWGTVFSRLLSIALILFCTSVLHAAEPAMRTLSAHVVKVAEDGSSLDVDFRHPATKEVEHMTFYTDHQTGLSGFNGLRDLRAGQVVDIDYVEGEEHRFFIRRIARIKLSGPPAGLENFRGL